MKKYTLEEVNKRLKDSNVGVIVQQRGRRLYLVATLPPKKGTSSSSPHQQRIALKIHANSEGFQQAEIEAKKVGIQLTQKTFQWDKPFEKDKTTSEWIESFKKDYIIEMKLQVPHLTYQLCSKP